MKLSRVKMAPLYCAGYQHICNVNYQSPRTFREAAFSGDARLVESLLDDVGKTIPISADFTCSALHNTEQHGPGIIDLVLARWQRGLLVLECPEEDLIPLIVQQLQSPIFEPEDVAKVLRVIENRGFKLSPSIALVRLVAKIRDDNLYKQILRNGEAVTLIIESILVYMAERMTAEMFDFFLDVLGDEVPHRHPRC